MSIYKVPFDAQIFLLQKTTHDNLVMGLYTNPITGLDITLVSLQECTNLSYARIAINKDMWTFFTDSDGYSTAYNIPITFNFGVGDIENIYGAFVIDVDENRLMWIQEFPVEKTVGSGADSLSITPVIGVAQI